MPGTAPFLTGTRQALREHRVVVVGAGVGGLVSALLLAREGLRVTLVERAATPGGKMRQTRVAAEPDQGAGQGVSGGSGDGASDGAGDSAALIDAGPTVFTMRWVFEQIFQRAGASLSDHVTLRPLGVLARHAWGGGSAGGGAHDPLRDRLDLFADPARSAEAIGRFAGPNEARRFVAFCAQARRVYDTLEGPYIRSQRPTLAGMATDLGPRGLAVLAGLGPFATLWRALARHFHDPRLQQLFGRYATYCGASPMRAPATLMLVAQVEMDGVWAVDGGMFALAQALADLAVQRGAELRFGTGCDELLVHGGRVSGVRLSSGETLAADSVVFNGDAGALPQGLLGADPGVLRATPAANAFAPQRRSLSAVTWAIHARSEGFPLVRHNVFFDADYRAEFRDIFERGRLPERGTVYVCAQDRDDAGDLHHPGAAERLLCLVNAPARGDQRAFDPAEIDPCEQSCFALLKRCGLTVHKTLHNTVLTTPADFHRRFPATGGALYGTAQHGWLDAFRRPGAASRLPGLYLAGGSVHPGPGVPMAAMSGQLAAATLMAHLASTRRSARVHISGGMSMRSATTDGTG